ncbi:11880_t:CDS:2, partial [Scutellospora calospora]
MKTLITLHNFDYIIEVVKSESEYGPAPEYLCKCNDIQSEVFLSPTNAISSVYQKIMNTATKFLGPAIMEFDNSTISNILIQDFPFQVYALSLEKLRIWILGIEKSNKSEWNYAGTEFDDEECKLTIYNKQMIVSKTFTNINPDQLWSQVNCLQQYNGKKLFRLEEPYMQNLIQSIKILTCTLDKWNNSQIMECVFNYHLKCRILTHKAMLKAVGYTEITLFSKDQSEFIFWSRSHNPEIDKTNLELLYKQRFLNPIPSNFKNHTTTFWESFRQTLDKNKRRFNGKTRILSIIADNFTYNEIKTNLNVSNDAICYAYRHARLNGPGCAILNKPIITRQKISVEKQQALDAFLMDKAHVVMSSYKTDTATNEPVHYLKHTKKALWEKFHEQYPDRIKRTSFYKKLEGNKYTYREDLGGLYHTCQQYGYEIFSDLTKFIDKYVIQLLEK